jgi:hypothetical protein
MLSRSAACVFERADVTEIPAGARRNFMLVCFFVLVLLRISNVPFV